MKLLIPVDGSSACNAAIAFVVSRTRHLGTPPEFHLLNVQTPIPLRAARAAGRELVQNFHRTEADRILVPARKALATAGFKPKAKYRVGNPGAVVSRMAARSRVDLVVMGSRGLTALRGLAFGSVTQAVLAGSTVPVLVVRGGQPPNATSLRVAIAVDGSRYSQAAVRAALELRALLGPSPQFRLLHVADPQGDAAGFDDATLPGLTRLARAGVDAERVRIVGRNAGDAIIDHLAQHPADLLVLGSHGRGAFKSALLGSVATRIAARCKLPLLIARPHRRRMPRQGGVHDPA